MSAFLIVLDSVGCGGAPDAAAFGDEGANTLGHVAAACAAGRADAGRVGPLRMPVLDGLGLGRAVALASGLTVPFGGDGTLRGRWGAATATSAGKDTPSGHWELAGQPMRTPWTVFPDTCPAFPPALSAAIATRAGTAGILGNRRASGTEVLEDLGAEHLRTGWPICYTSADSVVQIAAHTGAFGLERLLDLCAGLAPMVHGMGVGRVIARPFDGAPGAFQRTPDRRDFAIPPPAPTLLDAVQAAGHRVEAVGKIGDIFAHRGIDRLHKGADDRALMDHLHRLAADAPDGALVMANLVEFDTLWGHRRDVAGYARALEWIDAEAGRFLSRLRFGDLVIFTADHGNDPTWHGTEHTRERVPVLAAGRGVGQIGAVAMADVGASVAAHLGVPAPGPGPGPGRSFL
ncbi:phosphopentomutase [Rhodobaculum claviforme]|uniref:Phosphopentomutase n=1 Tax=Rhodobaculum claviforme TaxID=1549854 RepID=A0A934WJV3_9RHOB|nr:phosphopentomutase [Rhodobaculum claviforme]